MRQTYQMNEQGRVIGCDGYSLQTLLNLAAADTMVGRYTDALTMLSTARLIARDGRSVRCKAIAAHCTQAIQSLLPLALEQAL